MSIRYRVKSQAACGLLALGLLCACSSAPVEVGAAGYAPALPAGPGAATNGLGLQAGASAACSFYLQPVADLRADKVDMGTAGGRPVHVEDMAGWLTVSIESLHAAGFRVDTQAREDDRLVVHVALLKAYMHDMITSISTNVVVRVDYLGVDGSTLGQQIYRGVDTSMDWAAGDGEINTDFRLATTDLLKQMEQELSHYCGAAPPPASAANTAP